MEPRPGIASSPPPPVAPAALDLRDLEVAPLPVAETIPSAWCVDPEFDALDRHVLQGGWHLAGHRSEVPEHGSFITTEAGGEPALVVRAGDRIRAFHNVCRHRGGPLCTARGGRVRMLQCQYHGWTYRLDGMLRGVPRFDRTDLFDRRDYGLVPLSVDEWEGFVFVSSSDGLRPAAEMLAGIRERIYPIRLEDVLLARSVRYDVACNWKVYVDNYLEGYHLPLVHPELCDRLDYRAYRTEVHGRYSLQHSPVQGSGTDGFYADEAYYYFVFPNIMLNVLPGRVQTNVVLPAGPERCTVLFGYYYSDAPGEDLSRRIEEDVTYSDRIQQEDIEICEAVQRGLRSRAYDRGRFSVDAEAGVHHFQSLLRTTYASLLGHAPDPGGATTRSTPPAPSTPPPTP